MSPEPSNAKDGLREYPGEGQNIRAAERITGIHRDTIMHLGCSRPAPRDRPQGRLVRIHRNVGLLNAIISYRTGKRDSENADLLMRDLRERSLACWGSALPLQPCCKPRDRKRRPLLRFDQLRSASHAPK